MSMLRGAVVAVFHQRLSHARHRCSCRFFLSSFENSQKNFSISSYRFKSLHNNSSGTILLDSFDNSSISCEMIFSNSFEWFHHDNIISNSWRAIIFYPSSSSSSLFGDHHRCRVSLISEQQLWSTTLSKSTGCSCSQSSLKRNLTTENFQLSAP